MNDKQNDWNAATDEERYNAVEKTFGMNVRGEKSQAEGFKKNEHSTMHLQKTPYFIC
jgi:hypothetical protein